MRFQPVVKWIGSKRHQSEEIVRYFPEYINTYYEPFCGGCSVVYQFLESQNIYHTYMNRVVCSDINGDLIDLWKTVKNDPKGLMHEYTKMWCHICDYTDIGDKRKYFEEVRDEFNQTRSPYLFFFLMRTCTNGLPRYNRFGEFNQTLHLSRDGMRPDRLMKTLSEWSDAMKRNNVVFRRCDYTEILKDVDDGDFLYLDPPYELTRSTGLYFGKMDFHDMFDRLRGLNEREIKYALSFDGVNDDLIVPGDVYENVYNVKTRNGGFRTMTIHERKDKNDMFENLYVNF